MIVLVIIGIVLALAVIGNCLTLNDITRTRKATEELNRRDRER